MVRVVVFDDYEPTLRAYTAILGNVLGEAVSPFSDPQKALRHVAETDTALIVIDYEAKENIAFVKELRRIPGREQTPIVMISERDDRASRDVATGAGVTLFATKPLDGDGFAKQLRLLLAPQPAVREMQGTRESELLAIEAVYRAYAARDPDGAKRMQLVRDIAVLIAIAMRCTPAHVQLLREAGHVYDVGKLTIPEKTLTMAMRPSEASRQRIEGHAAAGAEILNLSGSRLFAAASVMAITHHERWDGMGYPKKMRGEEIPVVGRILAVADALVAMQHARADRPAMTFGHALDQIRRESGTHFDPGVVHALETVKDKIAQLRG